MRSQPGKTWLRVLPIVTALALAACQTPMGPSGTSDGRPAADTRPPDGAKPEVLERQRAMARPVPAWMVGKYTGRHLTMPIQDITLEIAPTGRMVGRGGGLVATAQYIGNDRILWSHGSEAIVQRQPTGFRLVRTSDPNNVVEYTRVP